MDAPPSTRDRALVRWGKALVWAVLTWVVVVGLCVRAVRFLIVANFHGGPDRPEHGLVEIPSRLADDWSAADR